MGFGPSTLESKRRVMELHCVSGYNQNGLDDMELKFFSRMLSDYSTAPDEWSK
jgi:hypothetical protein